MKNNYTTIIWDWNGTLLNDVDFCISIVNVLLSNREKAPLTKEKYLEIFNFPVKDYYKKAGFDFSKEDFKTPADQFIDHYNRDLLSNTDLHTNAKTTLQELTKRGYDQIVLSAMEQNALHHSIKSHQIEKHFNIISGINNHYAASKLDNAKKLIDQESIDIHSSCLIGDTVHDHEVAEALGCDCILIAAGHQNEDRLKRTNRLVLNNLTELKDYL